MSNSYTRSEALLLRARAVIPGGVSSGNRANWTPFPLYYARGDGARVWDVDGNEYIDYVLGRGPLILGHGEPELIDAIYRQLKVSQFFAGQIEAEIELAELICSLVNNAEMVRFCNSGSEAIHACTRLARSATGREKIIRFIGHYHGWYDGIAWGFSGVNASPEGPSLPVPMSLGQPSSDASNILAVEWNDPEAVTNAFEKCRGEVAAVITEPIMFNGFWSNIHPFEGFLRFLREQCDANGALLVFDEVQTGFRISLGGAAEHFGVAADLSAFAKALSGGVCLAAFAGRTDVMKRLVETNTVHTGTYNAYPPAVAGALRHLTLLAASSGAKLQRVHHHAALLERSLRDLAGQTQLPLVVRASPGAVTTAFRAASTQVINHRSAAEGLDFSLQRAWHLALQDRGVRITPEGLWYLSAAHSAKDIAITVDAARDALQSLSSR
ncbi:aspartate aminotransferase family protein [Mesorhizobium sp. M5C.F.Ca.IN.020.29.1.1]|uniref:aspartate aminotransferase family protein n=1 Tax=Mesorhizobium sp. M5C.F.Ca.IN.020.29.1.1 TaxID=2496770 RepID=UPI000FC9EE8C|nr:aspartate aminotransferase family protein [Mesorhizobium sp. M5C.F.Ca.IN.020.29.1.1]RUV47948.1 aspartate aminotransferase family protein [Mesorhizobium sp. M5C.F.Ca.IN.020.29.1.1]